MQQMQQIAQARKRLLMNVLVFALYLNVLYAVHPLHAYYAKIITH
jgi:hypothetical protein